MPSACFFFREPNLVVSISRKFQVHRWSGSQVTGTLSGGTYIFLMKYERKREKLLFYLLLLRYKTFIHTYYLYYGNLRLISYHLRGHSLNLNNWNLGIWPFVIWYFFGQKSENVVKDMQTKEKFYQIFKLNLNFHKGNIDIDTYAKNYIFLVIFLDFMEWGGI